MSLQVQIKFEFIKWFKRKIRSKILYLWNFESHRNISIQFNNFSLANEKSTILACFCRFCPTVKNSNGSLTSHLTEDKLLLCTLKNSLILWLHVNIGRWDTELVHTRQRRRQQIWYKVDFFLSSWMVSIVTYVTVCTWQWWQIRYLTMSSAMDAAPIPDYVIS